MFQYMSTIDTAECRAALTLIRRAIEDHCPPGVLQSEESVNGVYGPAIMHEAAALAAAIVKTVDRLSFEPQEMPPAPSIKT
ncbi:hypothetical protein AB6802_13165 [Mesorhizobium sp. RCC_202]|uniref:hypothetical protein n=1 Tax=Mesorhizobium sp. RCC_202 TaxID=3239222 RepID=UPI00352369B2